MTIYQEELMRNLSKYGCTGKYIKDMDALEIFKENVFLGRFMKNGVFHYSENENTGQLFGTTLHEIGDEIQRIGEYVRLYEKSPQMSIPEVKQYRKFSEYGDTVLAGTYNSHGFMFCTWKQAKNGTYIAYGDYSPNFEYAKESFVRRSGLINENRLFNEQQATLIYKSIAYTTDNCDDLTYDQRHNLEELLVKLAFGYKSLEDYIPGFDQDETSTQTLT